MRALTACGPPPPPSVYPHVLRATNCTLRSATACHAPHAPQRIEAYDKVTGLNSILAVNPNIMDEAKAMDVQLLGFKPEFPGNSMSSSSGKGKKKGLNKKFGTPVPALKTLPPLFCIPVLYKDNYDAVGG